MSGFDLRVDDVRYAYADVEALRGADCGGLIPEVGATADQCMRDRAIDDAGIEVAKAVMGREPLGERALAGSSRSVDGDDHLVLRFRSSQTCWATSDANFGIKGALANIDSGAVLNLKFL